MPHYYTVSVDGQERSTERQRLLSLAQAGSAAREHYPLAPPVSTSQVGLAAEAPSWVAFGASLSGGGGGGGGGGGSGGGGGGGGGGGSRPDATPLWFHAVVTGLRPESCSVDLEYAPVQMETRFGDACDGATLNILLPELCISVDGLVVDLIDRGVGLGLAGQRRGGGEAAAAAASLIAAKWIEPSAAQREDDGLLGTLLLRLEQPILFHLVAEAARLTLLGKGALFVLNRLIGERTCVRIEADVELAQLSVRLSCREAGIYLSISELELELARDGDVRCRSAEGGFVEWLVRAIPAMVLAWIKPEP